MIKHKLFVPLLCTSLAFQPISISYATTTSDAEAVLEAPVEKEEPVVEAPAEKEEPVVEAPVEKEEPVVEAPVEKESTPAVEEEDVVSPQEESDAPAEPEETKKTEKEFLDSLNVTDNFVIYADTFNENCHIDGNIAVNNLTTSTGPTTVYYWDPETSSTKTKEIEMVETLKRGGSQGEEQNQKDIDNYSIIYNGNELTYGTIDNGAVVVSGGDLGVQNLNSGSKLVDITDELNNAADKKEQIDIIANAVVDAQAGLTDEEKAAMKDRVTKEADIDRNLANIATKAADLNKKLAAKDDISGVDAAKSALEMVNSKTVTKDSIIAINVTVDQLNDSRGDQLTGTLNELLKANKDVGAQIILNVVHGDETSLTITQPLNGNAAYDEASSYIVWNFGDFGGTVTYTLTTEGIIVAPKATVSAFVMDGRIIAQTAIQQTGQEIHQPNADKKAIPSDTPSETPSENPSEEPSEDPSETPSEEPSEAPSEDPSEAPSENPSEDPSEDPSEEPSEDPSEAPSEDPSEEPSEDPSEAPSEDPSETPSERPELPSDQYLEEDPSEEPSEETSEQPEEPSDEYLEEDPSEEPSEETEETEEEDTEEEEDIDEDEDNGGNGSSDKKDNSSSSTPKTGDHNQLGALSSAFVLALLALGSQLVLPFKKRKDEE